jgi:isopentenyldiphosphate isomerase
VHYWFTAKPKKLYLRLEVGPFLDDSGADRAAFVQKLRTELGIKEKTNEGSIYTRIKTISTGISEERSVEDLKTAMEGLWKSMEVDQVKDALKAAIAIAIAK